jgi:hypothetical protein
MADDNTARLPRFPFSRGNVQPGPASRPSENDPLSELARLIGHTDPFATTRSSAPAHAAQDYHPEDYRADDDRSADYPDDQQHAGDYHANGHDDGWPGSPAAAQAGYRQTAAQHEPQPYHAQEPASYQDDQYGEPQQAYAEHQDDGYATPAEYGQTAPEGPYYGDNGQLLTEENYAPEHYSEEAPPRRRSGLVIGIAIVALIGLGAAGAYGYRAIFTPHVSGPPPVIKADTGPNKVVPTQVTDTSGNKQIYDRIGGSGAPGEKIVSREEQPVDVKAANTRASYPSAASSAPPTASNQVVSGWPTPPGISAANGASSPTEPRKVKTIPVRPDQMQGSQGGQASAAQQYAAPAQPAPARAAAPVQASNAPVSLAQPAAPSAPARPQAVASAGNGPLSLTPGTSTGSAPVRAAPVRTTSGNGYFVQIAAPKTEEDALAAFRSAQARYPDVLGGRQAVVRRKEVAGVTYYGAQVGPFAAREDANQLCSQLKSAGGQCLVQKN